VGAGAKSDPVEVVRFALLGNPNTGKTTLFNRLTGLRHKTSNFPGTTLEARAGWVRVGGEWRGAGSERGGGGGGELELVDLPGVYSLELELLESRVAREALEGAAGSGGGLRVPEGLVVVVDGMNLGRNLRLVGEALRRRLPTVVAVNMIDLARKRGLKIDRARLEESLGCGVVLISARTGEGIEELKEAVGRARVSNRTPPGDEAGLTAWAEGAFVECASGGESFERETLTDRLDRAFTHPVLGVGAFVLIAAGLFYAIFSLATVPMDLIDGLFGEAAGWVHRVMPAGLVADFLADGVIAGVGATVIFLPQICLLFFLISLLEDTGYLARAALVMDRVLRPFGLPGHAFVPLLSSHACALPGIMACRAIPDPKERLAAMLVAPFMTCSARLPVYVLLTGVLFPGSPAKAALAFMGCYALGIGAGVMSALVARRTILRGKARAMAIELPTYKWPSVRTAALTTVDRGLMFLKKAGTVILAISVVLWWLGNFPKVGATERVVEMRERAALVTGEEGEKLTVEADRLETRLAREGTFLGRAAHAAAPVFAPMGADWQITVGILASFAAREVFVSTMAVVVTGSEDAEDDGVLAELRGATRADGGALFPPATAWALLVFYVLAMQCLPTLAVTARESGHVKWALLQLGWMSVVAYVGAVVVYWLVRGVGG
jgi:ferrous iron transport protein B